MSAIHRRMRFKYPKLVSFECRRCALCCGDTPHRVRHILLLPLDVERVSANQLIARKAFATALDGFEPYGFQMKKTVEGRCIFLRDNECSIYDVRPLICRFYPFYLQDQDNDRYTFKYTTECPGIGQEPSLTRRFFDALFAEFTVSLLTD